MVGLAGKAFFAVLILALAAGTAHADVTDDQRLATLAGHMLNLTELRGRDFKMDCGPADEVVNLMPKDGRHTLAGSDYCILNMSGTIVFGTFVAPDPATNREAVLDSYDDSAYRGQVRATDVRKTACNGNKGLSGFERCDGALRYAVQSTSGTRTVDLYTYLLDDPDLGGAGSNAIYIIVSETPLNSLDGKRSIFSGVLDFFRRLFG